MTITVENISFSYGPRQALKDVSFSLNTGGFHALLGPNGAGKSTLFSLLTRLYQLQSGEITIDEKSIKLQPAELMQRLGVVFQQSTLDLDLTVKQNLLYHASLHGISSRNALPRIETELSRMEMQDRLDDKVRSLNGGHRRRVEIARALLHQPDIMLLDEPTVGLDPQTRRSLNQHVRKLCEEDNLTVLWATHLMEEINSDDPVILLHKGAVKINGKASELLNQSGANNLTDAFHILTENPEMGAPA
ncbi:ABC transporter ATP-binding protein [Neptuniibacter sp.]|uniref:ABC transporter ATP-binding protein n=1 Tax=Neptuniibacter sp. TaxID=1962643 RepID=UPI00260B3BEC|nr:ABC transporter ATP-binding protein [Neptuniibacter sp.]MCP4595838.1 ATP-binding cassette domain-containing protein [Neptuniibacter sp.]